MKLSFRWYGEGDSIPLSYIRQIPGMRSIVSAVYDVAPGEVWPEESLARMKALCEEAVGHIAHFQEAAEPFIQLAADMLVRRK